MKWDNQLINHLQWSNAIINREGKEIVAQEIAAMAKDGDVIGAGSGSTVYLTLFALAERIRKESLHIEVIPCLCRNFYDLHTIGYTTNDPLE